MGFLNYENIVRAASSDNFSERSGATSALMLSALEREAILAEYAALRAEILALVQTRNQFLIYDITGFGVVFGWAVAAPHAENTSFLIAPLIHYPMLFYWVYADQQLRRIGRYIRMNIEPRTGGISWESDEFARRSAIWSTHIFSGVRLPRWVKDYITRHNLTRYTPTEASGLATFIGSTVLALFVWTARILERLLSSTDLKALLFSPHIIHFLMEAGLFILDLFICWYSHHLIRKSRH